MKEQVVEGVLVNLSDGPLLSTTNYSGHLSVDLPVAAERMLNLIDRMDVLSKQQAL